MKQVSDFATKHPWTDPWWKAKGEGRWVLMYLLALHILVILGFVLYPEPGWSVFFSALALAILGGFGTTIAYHRSFAHSSVKLHPAVEQFLIFWAVFNGSGSPSTWIANHRHHHANSDTIDDVSSPSHGGFWWAHLRWLYQWEPSSMEKWCPEFMQRRYTFWVKIQVPLVVISLCFGYFLFGWAGFFWLGAIRLAYCLHGQCFVNSLLHMKPDVKEGEHTSRNIWWLGPLQLSAWGENLHDNHHSHPSSAKFSHHWWQVDIGWYTIRAMEMLGLATKVRTYKLG